MTKKASIFIAVFSLVLFFFAISVSHSARVRTVFVTIGTGGITGVYYPTGGAIAKLINKKRRQYGIRATVESTGGSVFNINATMGGDIEFGIARSDRQYEAFRGLGIWKNKGPQSYLRSVFSIHAEPLTLIAAEVAKIENLWDLKGKRVNIGVPGSFQRLIAVRALNNIGINYRKDLKAESVKAADAVNLIYDDRIDAFFYAVSHPSGIVKNATTGPKKVHIVPITDIDRLLKEYPYYVRAEIPLKFYPGLTNDVDIPTFGTKSTLVTSARVPDHIVYAITKEVFDNLEDFKRLHPAYYGITKKNMLEGLSAPIHPGAMRYFKEAGLK